MANTTQLGERWPALAAEPAALAWLGILFCPRLRDLPDRKLACVEPSGRYPDLQPLMGRRIKVDVVREHWGEVVRLVTSLYAGAVAPSVMLKKLAAYRRQNQLDLALQELGRIERTLFIYVTWNQLWARRHLLWEATWQTLRGRESAGRPLPPSPLHSHG